MPVFTTSSRVRHNTLPRGRWTSLPGQSTQIRYKVLPESWWQEVQESSERQGLEFCHCQKPKQQQDWAARELQKTEEEYGGAKSVENNFDEKLAVREGVNENNKYVLGNLRVPFGYLRVPLGNLRVPLGYLRVPLGYLRAPLGYLRALIKHSRSVLI